jgi:glutamine synthetase
VLAALDGIKSKTDPGLPLDKDLYDLPAEQLADVPSTPATLEDALVELEQDHEFLLAGDVFTADTIRAWVEYKREREVDQLRLRPHPYEFALYYDI